VHQPYALEGEGAWLAVISSSATSATTTAATTALRVLPLHAWRLPVKTAGAPAPPSSPLTTPRSPASPSPPTRRSFHYPKYVFSAAGGWFNKEPAGWERATLAAFAIMGSCAAAGFYASAARERRPTPPLWPIASQGWSAHAKEDGLTR